MSVDREQIRRLATSMVARNTNIYDEWRVANSYLSTLAELEQAERENKNLQTRIRCQRQRLSQLEGIVADHAAHYGRSIQALKDQRDADRQAWREQKAKREQAERERDEARQATATARQSAALDMGSAVGWEHRALEAEAHLAAVPALVEALERARTYVEEWQRAYGRGKPNRDLDLINEALAAVEQAQGEKP